MANGTGKHWLGIIIAVVGLLIGSVGSVVAMAWSGGGRLTSVEKDVEFHSQYIDSDKAYSLRVDGELKSLRAEQAESKLRDARMEGHYKTIESYMTFTSEQTGNLVKNFEKYLESQSELEVKVEGIKKTVENLEKVD
jgi:hypothetical protein